MITQMLEITCRIIPFKDGPVDAVPDLPAGHDYTVNWKNPNWQILCTTIQGYIALIEDARFIKV